MNARYLLGMALATATLIAACGEGSTDLLNGGEDDVSRRGGAKAPAKGTGDTPSTPSNSSTPSGTDAPSGPVPTNSPAGKAFYTANVHPFLATSCGSCHGEKGPGIFWLTAADAEKSYDQLIKSTYAIPNSPIVEKPAHGDSTTNVLSSTQKVTFNQWVEIEIKDGGNKAAPNILGTLGTCFDRGKFNAMQLGQWRTTRRTNNNNTNNVTPWNENANTCTGCDNAPCSTCHSADPATNYNNAVGSPILPADTTFENTKLTSPAYITKYFGVSPDGKPMASDGIKKKSDSTKKDKAYGHPMYQLNANQQAALDAFVNDAISKYNAGSCGK